MIQFQSLQGKKLTRILVFVAVLMVVAPSQGGPPLTAVTPCADWELTNPGGSPMAWCMGFGTCTQTGTGRAVLALWMSAYMDCPNQAVFNEVRVRGEVGGNSLHGDARGWCAENGRLRGQGISSVGCDGTDIPLATSYYPEACLEPPLFYDPPPPPGSGPVYCYNLQEQYECQEFAGFWDSEFCRCDWYSPILIDVLGNGFDLTDVGGGITFDLRPDGNAEQIAWTAAGSDDSFLALDRNGNGRIDDGAELFGNFTRQPPSPSPNGFLALAEYDKPENGGNSDEVIDRRDSIFSRLLLWRDNNHNGISEADELDTVSSIGITRMDTAYRLSNRRDQYGNSFRYRAKVYDSRGAQVATWAWDVFFVH